METVLPHRPISSSSGTKNIEIGVDNDGFIFLGYEADEMNDDSKFLWSRNYSEAIDAERAQEKSKKNRYVVQVQHGLYVLFPEHKMF